MENLAIAVVLQSVKDYFKGQKEEVEKWLLKDDNIFLDALNLDGKTFLKLLENSSEKDIIARIGTFEF